MQTPLGFEVLKDILHRRTAQLPDHRTESPNTRYAIHDAALGALGIFFTQSPSFLEYQRRLQHTKGYNNAQTLCGVAQIPWDNQIRTLLDPLAPSHLDPVCVEIVTGLEPHHMFDPLRVLGDQLLVALDGTTSFASQTIHCPNCLTRHLANGHTRSYHPGITPVMVCPGRPEVLALPPESIMPHDGQATQDGAQEAGKRWLSTAAKVVAPHQVTFLGDDLSRKQPFCALALQQGLHCILTCQPDSHATLAERWAFWQANDGIAALERRRWHGRFTAVRRYRYIHDVRRRDGDDALSIHWFEITVVNAKTGAQLSHNSCITHHRLHADHVADVADAGRGRWKIANEHHNVLKTKGSHLEHNFGHGQHSLSAFLRSLNLLAFLLHTVLEWSDDQ